VTSIESNSVVLNPFFKNFILPEGLLSIGRYSFEGATALTSINIPASLTTFGEYPFMNNTSLTNINVAPANAVVKSVDGVVYSHDGTKLIEYPDGKKDLSFVIPDGVTSTAPQWIWSNKYISKITVPSSVTVMGYGNTRNDNPASTFLIFKSDSSITSLEGGYAKHVIYCGTANPVITDYALKNGSAVKCETTAPSFKLSKSIETVKVGSKIAGYSISSKVPADGYTIAPSPSGGLYFDSTTGLLAGVPISTKAAKKYTITGVNSLGAATASYSVTVLPAPKTSGKNTSITCKKSGQPSKVISGAKPVCPTGYTKG
jgi:hypothetical protein